MAHRDRPRLAAVGSSNNGNANESGRPLKASLVLIALWLLVTAVAYFALPSLTSFARLAPSSKISPAVYPLLYLTIALWASQSVITLTRAVFWLGARLGMMTAHDYVGFASAFKEVQSVTLWALGIATALAAYLTTWFQ